METRGEESRIIVPKRVKNFSVLGIKNKYKPGNSRDMAHGTTFAFDHWGAYSYNDCITHRSGTYKSGVVAKIGVPLLQWGFL